ncbi:integrase core domain-containing protein [Streptomyces sp. NPDC002845]
MTPLLGGVVDQVERAIFQWVTWHNEERLHSALDYVPPAEHEGEPGDRVAMVWPTTKQDQPLTRSPRSGADHQG